MPKGVVNAPLLTPTLQSLTCGRNWDAATHSHVTRATSHRDCGSPTRRLPRSLFIQTKTQINSERFPLAFHMLISGLTTTQVEYLINIEVDSNLDITILFKPFADQRPSFVATIYGLTLQNKLWGCLVSRNRADQKEVCQTWGYHYLHLRSFPTAFWSGSKRNYGQRSPANGGNFWGWNTSRQRSCEDDKAYACVPPPDSYLWFWDSPKREGNPPLYWLQVHWPRYTKLPIPLYSRLAGLQSSNSGNFGYYECI